MVTSDAKETIILQVLVIWFFARARIQLTGIRCLLSREGSYQKIKDLTGLWFSICDADGLLETDTSRR